MGGREGLLENRTAIVTGGGGGIGRGISERFAAEGATVAVVELDAGRAEETGADIEAAGGRALAVVADVREPDGVERARAATLDAFGRIDVLVNNVGHYGGPRRAFHEQDDEEWRELYRVNFQHVMRMARAAIPSMLEQGGGAIVNVSTVEAFRAIPTRAVYSGFKSAISGFTRSLAIEYAHAGIRVNAVAPDVTETLQVPYARMVPPEQRDLIPTWVPLGRFGQPADVAAVVLFLASDLAGFVTGVSVPVDGGTLTAGGWFPTGDGGWTNRPRNP
jgi:2-hydroxycyclohexanecarboxyl-CoA dehydrogenase